MNESPFISILTPCYQSSKFLENCINSVAIQEYPFAEHIVQDGGSDDGTLEILKKYDGRVSWVSEKDSGQSDGLNRALQRCKGDIIGVLNADDEYEAHALTWAIENFEKNPDIDVIYGDQLNVDEHNNILFKSEGPEPYDFNKILCCENVIPAQAAFVRRSAMQKVGFHIDVSRKTCPDYEMWVRLGLQCKFMHVPGYVARYRIHAGSEGQQSDIVFKMVESKLEVIDRVLSDPKISSEYKKLKNRARAGVFEWSAWHFLPPHTINSRWIAHKQLRKAFKTYPTLRGCLRITIEPIFYLLGLDRVHYPSIKNKIRGFLRALDQYILFGFIYNRIYLPKKNKKLASHKQC